MNPSMELEFLAARRAQIFAANASSLGIGSGAMDDIVHPQAIEEETMALTLEEIQRAWQIKRAAQQNGLKPVSDFTYVQYAICTPDEPIDTVVMNRMRMMEHFRDEYQIQDTLEDAMDAIQRLTIENPGQLIAFEYVSSSRNFLAVEVWRKLLPANILRTDASNRTWLASRYYLFQAMNCQFRAMRVGPSQICECLGASLEENCNLEWWETFLQTLQKWYPRKQHEYFFLNTPSCVNFVKNCVWRFVNPQIREKVYLGKQLEGFEGRSIEELYNTPTPELARQRVVGVLQTYLHVRRCNEQKFRLPKLAELEDGMAGGVPAPVAAAAAPVRPAPPQA